MKTIICYLTTILLIGLLLIGCSFSSGNKCEKNEELSLTGCVTFNHKIDSLLHLFVKKANCQDCCYEMYIDKRDPDDTIITLVASFGYFNYTENGKELIDSYLKFRKPTMYTKVGNKTVFIITGIEDLICLDFPSKELESIKKKSSYYSYAWLIKIVNGEFIIYEGESFTPFSKLDFGGVIKWKAPALDSVSVNSIDSSDSETH